MLSPQTEIARSLIPLGVDPIRSQVVDIFPLPHIGSFETSRITLPIPAAMGGEDQIRYLMALRGEREFLVKRVGRDLPPLPETDDINLNHQFFLERGLAKLGLRNIQLKGNTLVGDHCLIPHPAYAQFSEGSNSRLREFGAVLGAAGILVTSDNKLLVQHRNPANRIYGDVPGASVAGLVDASLEQRLDLLDYARKQLLHEGQEEIGLSSAVTNQFDLTAIQIDKVALHHELTFSSKVSLTGDEIARNALKNRHTDDGASFRENVVLLDASPQTIERLLTEILSPFPMTHAGPILMLGHRLMDALGSDSNEWLSRVKAAMDANYVRIDELSESGKYSPAVTSTAQGLPSFRDELTRVFPGEHQYVACAW